MDGIPVGMKQRDRDSLDAQLPRGGGPIQSQLQAAEKELAALEELTPLDTRRSAARQEAESAARRVHEAADELKAARLLREPAKGGTKLTVVGYGSRLGAPPPINLDPDGLRRVAYSEYLGLSPDWLVLSQNFATGNGGGGYGDSGGPTFWTAPDGTRVLVAITSSGDPKLVSTGISQRIDISESLEFIDFVLWLMD